MSKLETNTIDNVSGSSTLTIGDSNTSTITLKSGATLTNFPDNTPAFEANLSANQTSVADHTFTKIQFDEERFDTDGCYDNSTNYRFTPTVAGKYLVYSYFVGGAGGGNGDNKNTRLQIYKNGSSVRSVFNLMNTGYENEADLTITAVIDMNGSSDYLEIFASVNSVANSGSNNFQGDNCSFGAYRLIGV